MTEFIAQLIKFPEIKKKFDKLFSSELVSVQPLGLPSGQLYYFDIGGGIRPSVLYFDRDEYYAYDDMINEYLGDDYPQYLVRDEQRLQS